jgi:hypothetical protein
MASRLQKCLTATNFTISILRIYMFQQTLKGAQGTKEVMNPWSRP